MAEWYTPTQVQRALEAVWTKFEKICTPIGDVRDEQLIISYYGGKRDVGRDGRDDRATTGQNATVQTRRYNVYAEENARAVPLVTSHLHGHWRTDLEGRRLFNHGRAGRVRDNYGRAGLVFDNDDAVGLPRR